MDAPTKMGLDDFFAQGGTVEQLLRQSRDAEDYAADVSGGQLKQSRADVLVDLATAHAKFFHDPDGETYATYEGKGHSETAPLETKRFRSWLDALYFELMEKSAGREAINGAVATLSGLANFKGEEHRVFIRIAGTGDKVYLDLANAEWQIVEIDAAGWRVISADHCPVKFYRTLGMQALPMPVTGGSVEELRPFINAPASADRDDADFVLTISGLIMMFRPRGPYPILVLNGEQGAVKSSRTRALRRLIDPNKSDVRKEPRDSDDLIIAAKQGWVIALDNLSYIPPWLSDSLCRLSTGGGISKRQLYTNAEETIIDVQRPSIINGIEDLAVRGDLLDRAQIHFLPNLAPEARRDERSLWSDYDIARPRILGALLSAVSSAIKNEDTARKELKTKSRMADYEIWSTAAEYELPWARGTFLKAYRAAKAGSNQIVLDASIIAEPIGVLVQRHDGTWSGNSKELLHELNVQRGDERPPKNWPLTPHSIAGMVRRIAPNLRAAGIDVELPKSASHKHRNITFTNRLPPDPKNKRNDRPERHRPQWARIS